MSADDMQFRSSLKENGTSDIIFESVKKLSNPRNGKDFTKMTARFQYGERYGNETFFATYWNPGGDQRIRKNSINALVFVCHGYAEYLGESYDDIAMDCSTQVEGGCLVFGHDHVGHGRTTAGERAFVNNMEEYVDPVIAHIKAVQRWTQFEGKTLPVFLVGHSMGGLISILTLLREQSLFKGFIGIGPLVKLDPIKSIPFNFPPTRLAIQVFQRFFPSFSFPVWLPGAGINLHEVTRNQVFVQEAKGDKLRYHGGTKVRLAWILFESTEKAQENLSKINLPVLVLQGGMDRLADPEGSGMLFRESSSTNKEYQDYPKAFHALTVEIDDENSDGVKVKSDVQKRTVEWINQTLNTSQHSVKSQESSKENSISEKTDDIAEVSTSYHQSEYFVGNEVQNPGTPYGTPAEKSYATDENQVQMNLNDSDIKEDTFATEDDVSTLEAEVLIDQNEVKSLNSFFQSPKRFFSNIVKQNSGHKI